MTLYILNTAFFFFPAIDLRDITHLRLVIGSQIAQEFREAIYARLGLTGCAGVASNKLLSKLVSGTFKPNQQTVLLPESCPDLIRGLDHIQKLPGKCGAVNIDEEHIGNAEDKKYCKNYS